MLHCNVDNQDSVLKQGPDSLNAASKQQVKALPTALDVRPLSDSKPQLDVLKQLRAARSSSNSNSHLQPTSKESTTVAADIAVTASPQKDSADIDRQYRSAVRGLHTAVQPATAAPAAEIAVLPSYAEMRQRASISKALAPNSTLLGQSSAAAGGHLSAAAASSSNEMYDEAASTQRTQLLDMLSPQPMSSEPVNKEAPQSASAWTKQSDLVSAHSDTQQHQPDDMQNRVSVDLPGRWSNAAQAAPLIAAYDQDAPMGLLHPALQIDAGFPDARDTDRFLQPGLSRAAVSRMYTAAGMAAGVEVPRPRVLLDQLKGNVSFTDHLRAARSATMELEGVQ